MENHYRCISSVRVLFIVYMSVMIYQERKKLIKIDPNLEESYTGEYPRYINEVNEDDIPDEEYYPTMEEALQKADVYYDEYEPYQKNIDHLLVDMENEQYRFIYYQSIQKKKSMNTFATFKIREVNGKKQYAFLRSYVRDSEKFYKGIGDADKNTKAQLARSDYMQHYGIDKDALCAEVTSIFGYDRMGPKIAKAMNDTIDYMMQNNMVTIMDGKMHIK